MPRGRAGRRQRWLAGPAATTWADRRPDRIRASLCVDCRSYGSDFATATTAYCSLETSFPSSMSHSRTLSRSGNRLSVFHRGSHRVSDLLDVACGPEAAPARAPRRARLGAVLTSSCDVKVWAACYPRSTWKHTCGVGKEDRYDGGHGGEAWERLKQVVIAAVDQRDA